MWKRREERRDGACNDAHGPRPVLRLVTGTTEINALPVVSGETLGLGMHGHLGALEGVQLVLDGDLPLAQPEVIRRVWKRSAGRASSSRGQAEGKGTLSAMVRQVQGRSPVRSYMSTEKVKSSRIWSWNLL